MLEAIHITKDFLPSFSLKQWLLPSGKARERARALDDVSFLLPQGSILAVLGPNGAGKTTLLKILATLILPEQGAVTVNGCKLGHDDERIKKSIGLAGSGERSFYWRLTGRQNLEFFAAMYGLYGRDAVKRVDELAELFKIDYLGKRFDSYSTGMQQKCAILRALLHDPGILLLDEPTKSLDYTSARELRDFIKEHLVNDRKKSVIFTTHDMEEAKNFAGLFMILHQGKKIAFGTLEELKKLSDNPSASLGEIFVQITTGGRR
ncbi:MAG: ABC transporter ATP-binding protein [Candidatus Omnitrophota bacterium]